MAQTEQNTPNAVPVRKAIIIGGSMGGLFAGNLLSRAGWQADIYERVPGPLSDRGTGIVTPV